MLSAVNNTIRSMVQVKILNYTYDMSSLTAGFGVSVPSLVTHFLFLALWHAGVYPNKAGNHFYRYSQLNAQCQPRQRQT